MVYIVICFIMGIGLIIATIMSIVGNGGLTFFFTTGVNFFEIFCFLGYFLFGFFGLICIIAAINDYRKLKDDDNKNTATNETDEKNNDKE